jgi:hypothetical protein
MTSLPFPCFVNEIPIDAENNRAALPAVGRCRITPSSFTATVEEYRAICDKNKEQAFVDTDTSETKDENKKLKKKYMKQGVAMASKYLRETLKLDVSIIAIEAVVDPRDIIETDGCLAACLLDAGCSAIVIPGMELEAMDAAKIPRERIVAHFPMEQRASSEAVSAALALAGTISIELLGDNPLDCVDELLSECPDEKDKVSFLLTPGRVPDLRLQSIVASISKKCKDFKGKVGLLNPSATTLGLCYSACMRTDRDDGLYTTVVCTRSGEALGLVYSSKVSSLKVPSNKICDHQG